MEVLNSLNSEVITIVEEGHITLVIRHEGQRTIFNLNAKEVSVRRSVSLQFCPRVRR